MIEIFFWTPVMVIVAAAVKLVWDDVISPFVLRRKRRKR